MRQMEAVVHQHRPGDPLGSLCSAPRLWVLSTTTPVLSGIFYLTSGVHWRGWEERGGKLARPSGTCQGPLE